MDYICQERIEGKLCFSIASAGRPRRSDARSLKDDPQIPQITQIKEKICANPSALSGQVLHNLWIFLRPRLHRIDQEKGIGVLAANLLYLPAGVAS
jgi:hypothetical protein